MATDYGNGMEPELEGLAKRLIADRPVPRAAFRAEMRKQITTPAAPPRALRRLVSSYVLSGGVCLVVVAVGVFGAGPLDAGDEPTGAPRASLSADAGP